jgi:hypothetical protein
LMCINSVCGLVCVFISFANKIEAARTAVGSSAQQQK